MESADDHRYPGRPQRPGAVHHARELVRLHADEADHAEAAVVLDLAGDAVRPDAGVGLVDGEDLDRHVLAKDLIFHAFLSDAEQAGERIGGERRLPPLDDVALVVVVRRLDKEKQKTSARAISGISRSPRAQWPAESGPAPAPLTSATVTSPRPNAQSRGLDPEGRVVWLQRVTVTRK